MQDHPGRGPKGHGSVSFGDVKIRDVSRLTGEWTPPISAMGGPPAHELYMDLVLYAGLQLFRDAKSRPWVVLRDGAQRRAFRAPSDELRSALDRFRMRRNVRPVPESDIDEFVRIVEARVSDPDVEIPLLRSPMVERTSIPLRDPAPTRTTWRGAPQGDGPWDQSDTASRDLDDRDGNPSESPSYPSPPRIRDAGEPRDTERTGPAYTLDSSTSGARRLPAGPQTRLTRYLEVLRGLVRDGDWMGTTRELSRLTEDDPFTLFETLLKYRSQLADHDILIANIDVGDGYRWLAVDRAKVRTAIEARQASEPGFLAE